MKSRRARSLLLVVGLSIAVAFVVRAHTSYRASLSGDFYQFWVVGQAVSTLGITNPYTPQAREQIGEDFWQRARGGEQGDYAKSARYRRDRLEPAGTPFLYAFFRAVSSGRYERDYEIYRWSSLLAYAFGVVAMARVVGIAWPFALLSLGLLSEWFWPFRIEVAHANVNQLQIGALGALLLLRRHLPPRHGAALSGVLLGLLLGFKPNLLFAATLLMASFALRREPRLLAPSLAGFLCGGAFAVGSGMLFFGSSSCWFDWLQGSRSILESPDYLRRSLPGLLGVSVPSSVSLLAGAALCVPVIRALLRTSERESDVPVARELLLLGLGGTVLVLTGPVVHVHYFVLCVPMLIWTCATGSGFALPALLRRSVGAIALLLIGGIFGAHFTPWPFLGTALLYGLGVAELWIAAAGGESEATPVVPAAATA